jgi:hypothetical protein
VDDRAAILVAALDLHRRVAAAEGDHLLVLVHVVVAAAQVFVDRHVEAADVFFAVRDEVGVVLGVVLRAFCDEVAEAPHQLEAHLVRAVALVAVHRIEEARIEINPVLLDLEVEGHVVDARARERDAVRVLADVAHELVERALHAVTQADGAHIAGARDRLHVHAHRVRIVQQPRLGAELHHVLAKAREHGERAQRPEQSAGAGRVGDRKVQAVLARDLEVDECRIEPADLHHVDDKVGVAQRLAPIERRLDSRVRTQCLRDLPTQVRPDLEPVAVDVHVAERRVLELGNERMSPVRFLLNTTLPAPIMATLITGTPWEDGLPRRSAGAQGRRSQATAAVPHSGQRSGVARMS